MEAKSCFTLRPCLSGAAFRGTPATESASPGTLRVGAAGHCSTTWPLTSEGPPLAEESDDDAAQRELEPPRHDARRRAGLLQARHAL